MERDNLTNKNFDYIFVGGGLAALSLAYHLNKSSLRNKSILIIDEFAKNTNDHTWCFWEKENGIFEEIVHQKWNGFWFHGSDNFSEFLKLQYYQYKMIKSIDFYQYVILSLNQNSNIYFVTEKVVSISEKKVETTENTYLSNEFIFDSITIPKFDKPQYHNLLQHFLGWKIETKTPIFDINKPTLFDFRIAQETETRFLYIIPITENIALVEFTVFSDNILEKQAYINELSRYLEEKLNLQNKDYKILETEIGVIPMSDEPIHPFEKSGIIKIGTAGGFVKPSTGYSFQRTQKYCSQLVKDLENNTLSPKTIQINHWKRYLDSVLLNVMRQKRMPQDVLFTSLFKNNKADEVLQFLSEDSNLIQDLKLMNSVPKLPFIKSAIHVIIMKIHYFLDNI